MTPCCKNVIHRSNNNPKLRREMTALTLAENEKVHGIATHYKAYFSLLTLKNKHFAG